MSTSPSSAETSICSRTQHSSSTTRSWTIWKLLTCIVTGGKNSSSKQHQNSLSKFGVGLCVIIFPVVRPPHTNSIPANEGIGKGYCAVEHTRPPVWPSSHRSHRRLHTPAACPTRSPPLSSVSKATTPTMNPRQHWPKSAVLAANRCDGSPVARAPVPTSCRGCPTPGLRVRPTFERTLVASMVGYGEMHGGPHAMHP
jgi:hypothetical protein